MEHSFKKIAKLWATDSTFDHSTQRAAQELLAQDDLQQLQECFGEELSFGTGGLRGLVGPGPGRINPYTVQKVARAMGRAIKAPHPKVVLSYDGRHSSWPLAQQLASTLEKVGVEVILFGRPTPVPLLSFAVRFLKLDAGVMITASHNPPSYNGIKIYGPDGAQVTPPLDEEILREFRSLGPDYWPLDPSPGPWPLVEASVEEAYYAMALESFPPRPPGEVSVVYTPLHGTGLDFCLRALERGGHAQVWVVSEQARLDGDFPTVCSPNPEDPRALGLAVELMKKKGAHLAMASDPDADRLGVATVHCGQAHILSGNQVGLLMLHYLLEHLPPGHREEVYFINTVVSSPLQAHMATCYGVEVHRSLTGFKWIGKKMRQLESTSPHKRLLLATEESCGHLAHPHARDKDGVTSAALMAQVALWHQAHGRDLVEGLELIYQTFGRWEESLVQETYPGPEGRQRIRSIMDGLRRHPPLRLGPLRLQSTTDLAPQGDVLGFHYEGGQQLWARPSGTEPKIKFYLMSQEEGQTQHMARNLRELI